MDEKTLTYTERMIAIVQMLFYGRDITSADMKGYMLAFASDDIPAGADEAQAAEIICQGMINQWRNVIVDTVAKYNKKLIEAKLAEYEESIRNEADDKLSALIG